MVAAATAIAVKAIQQLKADNDKLATKLEAQAKDIEALEAAITK